MKNTIDTTSREAPSVKRPLLGNSPLLARLTRLVAIGALTAAAAACSDDNGKYTPGNQADAGISSDSGITGTDTSGTDAGSTTDTSTDGGSTTDAGVDSTLSGTDTSDTSSDTSGTADAGTTADASTDGGSTTDAGVDSTVSGTDTSDTSSDTSGTADAGSTIDTSISQDTTPIDTTVPSTPDIAPTPVKVTKSAPADEWMSGYVPGMELPVEQVIVSNTPYSGFVGFGHKDQIKPLGNDFVASVNGADVYTMKMADLPQNPSDAGKNNFRVSTMNFPAGTKMAFYISTLTGEKAQDGVTPLYDQGAILPVKCGDGEYNPEDAALLTQAMTMTGKMEFNHNLEELHDTYAAYLQGNINTVFAAAGKAYAPICVVQMVTPGTPGIVDGQVCKNGCMISYASVQPLAGWTPMIQQK